MATGLFIAEGVKVVSELVSSPLSVQAVYATDEGLLHSLTGDFRREAVSERELGRMSQLITPNTVLAVARIPAVAPVSWDDGLLLALDGLRDPGNMGTIIRTASWFGIRQILCSPDCVDAWSPKVVQGAMGALFRTAIIPCDLAGAAALAGGHGLRTVTATLGGAPLGTVDLSGGNLLVIGSESHGVSAPLRDACDVQVRIPSFGDGGTVESLNAAIAAGILLSHMRKNHNGGN